LIRVLDLFSAAAGGWSLGMHRAGYRTIAACEVIHWRRALYSENNPGVPVYDDVTTLTADRLVRDGIGLPDIVVGSPPCQDISSANTKGKGVDGERSGLYFEAVRLIDECRPRWFALENSANLRTRGADRVIDALEGIGYTCWPFVVSAGNIGANHERKRSWLIGFNVSHANDESQFRSRQHAEMGIVPAVECDAGNTAQGNDANSESIGCESWSGDNQSDERENYRSIASNDNGDGNSPIGNPANTNEARQEDGFVESSLRQAPQSDDGCSDGRSHDGQGIGEMGGSEGTGTPIAEPWADWNRGLAHHLRVDDGLSQWVAQSRIAVGGPRGTVAASLIVEAFGDAVCPQIPEAIGRAIMRVGRALAAVSAPFAVATTPANDNSPLGDNEETKAA
jgi:DNA (cytosine-5)-methyltransferase 1